MPSPPAYRQYRGTQTSEVISRPGPIRSGLNRTEETGDGVLAKDPEERRVDPNSGLSKLAAAGAAAFKKAPMTKPKAPGMAFATKGGDKMRVGPTGQMLINDGKSWRAPVGDVEKHVVRQRSQDMSNFDRHRLMTKLKGPDGKPLRNNSRFNRFMARGADMMTSSPMAHMAMPIAAHAAMRLIPAGRDEYGNKRSLADTGVGQIGAAMSPLFMPSLMNRGLSGATNRLMGAGIPLAHTPPPSPHPGGAPAGVGAVLGSAGTRAIGSANPPVSGVRTRPAPVAPTNQRRGAGIPLPRLSGADKGPSYSVDNILSGKQARPGQVG